MLYLLTDIEERQTNAKLSSGLHELQCRKCKKQKTGQARHLKSLHRQLN